MEKNWFPELPDEPVIVDVTPENYLKTGFFCKMSQKKSTGYKQKLDWLNNRFKEGLKLKMFLLPVRGFIEYIPGSFAWRGVEADEYMFINCLWVVGQSKGKGLAGLLINECLADARAAGLNGAAMLVSQKNWLAGEKVMKKYGFAAVDEREPYKLMVLKFNGGSDPKILTGFEERIKKHKNGLTVISSGQCPYLGDAVKTAEETAKELGIKFKHIEMRTAADIKKYSVSPYGTFGIIYNGELISDVYLLKKDLMLRLAGLIH